MIQLKRRLPAAILSGILGSVCSHPVAAGVILEEAPTVADKNPQVESITLRAGEILPQHVLTSPGREVLEFVPVENDRCRFTIRSEWGQFTVLGKPMLELRLRELAAIELSMTSVGNPKGNDTPGNDIPGSDTPVVTVSSVRLKRNFASPRGKPLQPRKTADALLETLEDEPALLWGTSEMRRVAFEIGCDPETSHPAVLEALKKLSGRDDFAGLLDARTGPPPFPATLLSVPSDQREALAVKKLDELQALFDRLLTDLGVDPEIRQNFCRRLPLSCSQKWLLIREFQPLSQIPGAISLFSRVVDAPDELAALEILQALKLSNNFQAREPLGELTLSDLGTELHTQRGDVALVRLGDYLTGNPPFTQEIARFRAAHPQANLWIISPAQISPTALKILENSRVKVFAN